MGSADASGFGDFSGRFGHDPLGPCSYSANPEGPREQPIQRANLGPGRSTLGDDATMAKYFGILKILTKISKIGKAADVRWE